MNKFILDTDFVIANLLETDSNHESALVFLELMDEFEIITTNLVMYETANVLSRILVQEKAIKLFEQIKWNEMERIYISESLENDAVNIYKSQTKKNISITDCVNLTLAKKLNLKIASFDKFYPKEYRCFPENVE